MADRKVVLGKQYYQDEFERHVSGIHNYNVLECEGCDVCNSYIFLLKSYDEKE